ncbi:MAG: winged helix-turn-helix domain-containing protein [Promethearchaeota archaeon]
MTTEEIMDKCKLTKEELKQYYKKLESIKDIKVDHSRAYRTLMNPLRREILEFIGFKVKTTEEIEKGLKIDSNQLNYHLSMLEQLNYVMNCSEGWKATPRGIGFLLNAQMD